MSSSWYNADGDTSSFVIDENKPLRQLHPNQFYKVCPSGGNSICGDGSPFCFYVSKPSQRQSNNERLLVELMGGGACWDVDTCEKQADYLYVNGDVMDNALGRSCQEMQYGLADEAANMLCASQIGKTDFSTYNTIIIPYCTQDVHIGSNTMTYTDNSDDDGGNGDELTVHHMGANNILTVLDWIYKNFANLRHATVTGCSAGGTAVPVVQQLLHQHYNHFGNRNTQLAALADSPVYLTPSYFLNYGLPNWNPQKLLADKMGVPYNKYKDSEDYPTQLWDYFLRKSDNRNRWGFVSHTQDPVSMTYYQYMSGNGGDNRRQLEDNGNSQWYSELSGSVSYIQGKHRNVKSFWMDGEGHCSFGLYYAMQEEGFQDFASAIVQEDPLIGSARPSVSAFFLAFVLGNALIGFLIFRKRRRTLRSDGGEDESASRYTINKDGLFEENEPDFTTRMSWRSHWKKRTTSLFTSYEDHPVVTGYAVCLCLYFWFMIIEEGFCHPVNNPSLGPNAMGLSKFGINNPALIVYKYQWFRLLTSNFLVTGVLTFAYANFYLWFRVRHLERRMLNDFNSPWLFITIAILLASVVNAIYCIASKNQGASATAIPLLMGLHACHLALYWNHFVRPYLSVAAILLDFVLVSLLFPFNSWVMMLTALVVGPLLARMARKFDGWLPGPVDVDKDMQENNVLDHSERRKDGAVEDEVSYETMDDQVAASPDVTKSRRKRFVTRTIFCGGVAVFVVVLLPFFITLAARPNKVHVEPFFTGCKLFYTNDIDGLSSSYVADDNEEGDKRRLATKAIDFARWLEGDENDGNDNYQCAAFCVPHLIAPVFKQVTKSKGIPIHRGTCQEQGYSSKVMDKTFSAFTYSLDVELYAADYSNNEDGA
ncbi:MAG: hypothetical protein SGILL_001306 [Bacillariaceae sp.]